MRIGKQYGSGPADIAGFGAVGQDRKEEILYESRNCSLGNRERKEDEGDKL